MVTLGIGDICISYIKNKKINNLKKKEKKKKEKRKKKKVTFSK